MWWVEVEWPDAEPLNLIIVGVLVKLLGLNYLVPPFPYINATDCDYIFSIMISVYLFVIYESLQSADLGLWFVLIMNFLLFSNPDGNFPLLLGSINLLEREWRIFRL